MHLDKHLGNIIAEQGRGRAYALLAAIVFCETGLVSGSWQRHAFQHRYPLQCPLPSIPEKQRPGASQGGEVDHHDCLHPLAYMGARIAGALASPLT